MANSVKPMRLAKAAKEFNVGVHTIQDFLKKKGYDEEFKPNSKLDAKMVGLLVAEYQSEKEVKEKADEKKIASERTPLGIHGEELTDSSTEEAIEEQAAPEVSEEDSHAISGTPHASDEPVEQPAAEEIAPQPPAEESLAAETTKEATPQPKEEAPAPVEERPVEKEEEAQPAQLEEVKPEPPQQEEEAPIATKEEVKKEAKEPTVETLKKTAPEAKAEEKVEEKVEEKAPEVEKNKAEKIAKPKADKENVKAATKAPKAFPKEEAAKEDTVETGLKGPKVLDKIDLDKTNWKTRPNPKTQAERKKEQKEKKRQKAEAKKVQKPQSKPVATPAKPVAPKKEAPKKAEAPEIEMIETKVEKLTGPKVLGTIKLEDPKKKTDNKRNKRKRIRKPVNPNAPGTNNTRGGNANARGGKGNDPHSAKGRGRKKAKPIQKQEPTDEEIRKQIKETLARLSSGGKSKASKHRRSKRDAIHKEAQAEQQKVMEQQKLIKVTEFVTANDLATMMEVPVTKIIATCMEIGLFVSINQRMDAEAINVVAEEFGFKVEFVGAEISQTVEIEEEDFGEEDLKPRAPIVTVMGHVDHGKTKLLDYVRKANVVAGEAGGITQHIGAYEVKTKGGKVVTFLDTPGHEAFTAMRARGAKVTDIAIIVIAADDKVMPQTVEAINHAQAAGIPIVFAINKIDRPTANPDNIKNELSQMNILVEDWGGKYQSQEISALKGDGIDELLEKVLLEAEVLDLHATPARKAQGSIIEASLDKGRGYVTKILVQDGTLSIGDMVLAGSTYGKVKAMFNERNQAVKEAGPSTPVLMLGLNSAPQAGDNFNVMSDEREVKAIASKREQLKREQSIRTQKHVTLDEIGRRLAIGDFKELNVIVKADVDGSAEALAGSLIKLSTEEVVLNVIHKSVGQITENDVLLASASDAIIVGFQVRPNMQARKLAETEGIQIKLYSIIYQAIEDVTAALEGLLSPDEEEKIVANIEVREVFKVSKVGTIAGGMVLDGKITRNTPVRLIRDGVVIYTGKLGSLKRFKDDVKEVASGYECGLNIENFNDVKVGDIVEGYETIQIQRKL